MTAYRDLFPITKNLLYFNHAAVGPLSVRAAEAMARHVADQREYGALHWRDWLVEVEKLRQLAARLLGAKPDEIAILKNTSEGLSFVAEGLRWNAGDNVITTAFEFPSNWTPWKRLEERGVECRVASQPSVEAIAPLIDEHTRLVTVSSVAFHNGFTADLEAIGTLCEQRDVLFCVDAIQSIGVLPMDVRRAKIHFLAADGHKWMCNAEGTALFYVAAEKRELLDVLEIGWTNLASKSKFLRASTELLSDARRFEAGSPNTNGVYGLVAALELIEEIGIENVSRLAIGVAIQLADAVESLGWTVHSPKPLRSAIVATTPPDVETSILWWHRRLEEHGVVCSPREGMLRFSPHFYNDASDVARLVEIIRKIDEERSIA